MHFGNDFQIKKEYGVDSILRSLILAFRTTFDAHLGTNNGAKIDCKIEEISSTPGKLVFCGWSSQNIQKPEL